MQISKKFIMEDKDGNNLYPASFTDIVFRADGIKLEDELDRIDSKDVEQDNKLSQHERRLTEVEGKGGSSNVLLEEEEQDKFNFVKNKVVQDGLVYQATNLSTQSGGSTLYVPTNDNVFTIDIRFSGAGITLKDNIFPFVTTSTNSYFALKPDGRCFYFKYTQDGNDDLNFTDNLVDTLYGITNIVIIIDKVKCNISIYGNGKLMGIKKFTKNIFSYVAIGCPISGYFSNLTAHSISIYNHSLTPAEIQHNFSVLNNSHSIKELHTTDSTGKTSILRLGSDSSHVEMDTGRTLQEELDAYRAIMAKEFISTDGTPIEVNNAFKSKVLGMSIKGQTLKNYCGIDAPTVLNKDKISKVTQSTQLNASKYDIVLYVDSVVGICTVAFYCKKQDGSHFDIVAGNVDKTGLYKFKIDMTYVNQPFTVLNVKLTGITESPHVSLNIVGVSFVEENLSDFLTHPIPFGLSSTQAIIENNGMKYPIYHPTELNEDGSKKVILCHKSGDVADTIQQLEDGSGVHSKNIGTYTFTGNEAISMDSTFNNTQVFYLQNCIANAPSKQSSSYICNNIQTYVGSDDVEKLVFNVTGIYIRVSKSKASTVDELRAYLKANTIIVYYQLATPIVTHIPKELVPAILTHNQTNILEVGGAVKPSNYKITLPVNKLSDFENRLQALEGTMINVVLNKN